MTNLPTFDRFLPSTLGFDRFFHVLDHASDFVPQANSFPPVNIVKEGENNYTVEIAVAGYDEDEIDVTVEKNTLKVSGKKAEKDEKVERNYVYRGIAGRSFVRSFILADTVEVRDASLKNGILTVTLENVIPEAKKPRKIPLLK